MFRFWGSVLAAGVLVGCSGLGEAQLEVSGGASAASQHEPPRNDTSNPGASSGGGGGAGGDAGSTPVAEGLPCDVAQVLNAQCQSCHGAVLAGGATVRLVTRDDLLAMSSSYSGQTMGERVVARMSSPTAPMPPGSPPGSAEVSVVSSWVNAGMPAGSCGAAADGGVPPLTDAGTPASVCSSGSFWSSGNSGSSSMNPGLACISCHQSRGAPTFSAAGTVYPTVREPDLCNGAGGVTVELTDRNGVVYTATTNSSGNFRLSNAVAMPYRARVIRSGVARAMATPQTSGDCNSCHTETGSNGAPGRIVAP